MEVLVITGLSGSGKSKAASVLEDIGFYLVDNLPAEMLLHLARFCRAAQGKYDRLAFVYDVRAGEPAERLLSALKEIKAEVESCKVLFLNTDTETIIHRYKETRRNHPLAGDGKSIEQAVELEREWTRPVQEQADIVLDTSTFSTAKLRSELLAIFGKQSDRSALQVNVMSFGFKYGLPLEADLVFDVRFMPNPYYVDELKPLTGLDEPVREFVFRYEETREFVAQLENMLQYLLPLYSEEGKSVLVVGIGCTGGHHRSVAITREIVGFLQNKGFAVTESHRDISR